MSSEKKLTGKHLTILLEKLVSQGKLRLTPHAKLRMEQREVTLEELCNALKFGSLEEDRCEYNHLKQSWTYSIRGLICMGETSRMGKQIRIIARVIKAPYSSDELLIITVIDPEKG